MILFEGRFWRRFWVLFKKNDVMFNASALTFDLLLCSIPFILLVTALLGFVLSNDQAMDQLLRFVHDFFPSIFLKSQHPEMNVESMITGFLQPIIARRKAYGLIGFGVLVFTSLGLFAAVKHVLYQIFEIHERSHPVREFVQNFFSFGLAGGVFVFSSVLLSILSIIFIKRIEIPIAHIVIDLGWLTELMAILVPIIFNLILFYIFFHYVSEGNISPKVSWFGSFTYTFLFEAAKQLFGLYLGYAITRFQTLYQGYAFVIMLGIWAFYGALTFVISALAAKSYQDIKYPSFEGEAA